MEILDCSGNPRKVFPVRVVVVEKLGKLGEVMVGESLDQLVVGDNDRLHFGNLDVGSGPANQCNLFPNNPLFKSKQRLWLWEAGWYKSETNVSELHNGDREDWRVAQSHSLGHLGKVLVAGSVNFKKLEKLHEVVVGRQGTHLELLLSLLGEATEELSVHEVLGRKNRRLNAKVVFLWGRRGKGGGVLDKGLGDGRDSAARRLDGQGLRHHKVSMEATAVHESGISVVLSNVASALTNVNFRIDLLVRRDLDIVQTLVESGSIRRTSSITGVFLGRVGRSVSSKRTKLKSLVDLGLEKLASLGARSGLSIMAEEVLELLRRKSNVQGAVGHRQGGGGFGKLSGD